MQLDQHSANVHLRMFIWSLHISTSKHQSCFCKKWLKLHKCQYPHPFINFFRDSRERVWRMLENQNDVLNAGLWRMIRRTVIANTLEHACWWAIKSLKLTPSWTMVNFWRGSSYLRQQNTAINGRKGTCDCPFSGQSSWIVHHETNFGGKGSWNLPKGSFTTPAHQTYAHKIR